MPVEARPLFRPETLRPRLAGFEVPEHALAARERVRRWADLLASPQAAGYKETELLPDFLGDLFVHALGYTTPVARAAEGRYTLSRERLVEVDGKFMDAGIGSFGGEREQIVVALEGKGPGDPLDRPHAGRKVSAVDQGYRYAINAPCDWIIITNLRQIRLYHKSSTQREYERFDTSALASDDREFARFIFTLGAERVVPREGRSHLYALLEASEAAGEELTQGYYREYARIRQEVLVDLVDANPDVPRGDVLTATQRLLDRTLFVAFAEDRGLLPPDTLAKAFQHRDPYNPRPIWANFQGLFRAIDVGSEQLGIPRYNGGLFREHPVLDVALTVSDATCERLKRLGDYNYASPRPDADAGAGLIDVEVLGHIFEQSIEDLEAIRAALEGGAEVTRATSKRKREGAFYTPSFVTRYMVEATLHPVLADRFERLRSDHQARATGTAKTALADPRVYDLEAVNRPQRDALVQYWEGWIEELKRVRVVDPACGSGAFLVEVFDYLHAEYASVVARLAELREGGFAGTLFDPDTTILQENIYGVDLNEEAVEIARLSIWIKTAQRGKPLADLDQTIRAGNSVVDDPSVDSRALDWEAAFPEVAAQGGFDAVVGNPPYVRAELLTGIKPHLERRYSTFHGSADLFVYFYELAVKLLRPGGRMSYIVTNKWMRTGYGEPLRRFFAEHTWPELIVDLGHAKGIFPDADVFPCIIFVRRPTGDPAPEHVQACVIPRDELAMDDLPGQIRTRTFQMPRASLGADPWTLEPPALIDLMDKMRRVGVPLREYLGTRPKYGLKTGFNEAYLISTEEREVLISQDPSCAELIQPYLRGQDLSRWRAEWANLWMIVMASSGDREWPWRDAGDDAERVFAETYPSIHAHLKRHEERLRKRTDQGVYWWELRTCDYYDLFQKPRIAHTDIAWRSEFALVEGPMYTVNTVYMWDSADLWVLAVLNSPLLWSYLWRNAQHGKDEALRLFSAFTETIPIARPTPEVQEAVSRDVRDLIRLARQRQESVAALLEWLRVEFGVTKPGNKLTAPDEVDLDTFVSEVKQRRSGGRAVSSAELRRLRDEHQSVTDTLQAASRRAAELERAVAGAVHAAYGLSEDEITLLWRTAPPRMPQLGAAAPTAASEAA